MSKQIICVLFDKTPGALRYRQIDSQGNHISDDEEGALVRDFYLRKAAMSGRAPDKITVTVEYARSTYKK